MLSHVYFHLILIYDVLQNPFINHPQKIIQIFAAEIPISAVAQNAEQIHQTQPLPSLVEEALKDLNLPQKSLNLGEKMGRKLGGHISNVTSQYRLWYRFMEVSLVKGDPQLAGWFIS